MFSLVDRNRLHLRRWLPWVDNTRSAEDVRAFIAGTAAKYAAGEQMNAAIWIDGEIAGAIGHHDIDWPNRSVSLGYWIAAAHQGKGIITRCCHVLLDYLFDECGLHRVEIRCGLGNERSGAVPRRLGFTREGVIRQAQWVNDSWIDLAVWGMLEHEWRK